MWRNVVAKAKRDLDLGTHSDICEKRTIHQEKELNPLCNCIRFHETGHN